MNTNEQQTRETLASFALTEQTLYAEIVRKLRELAEAEVLSLQCSTRP